MTTSAKARGLKGFVLAAGYGTRLRPLTDHYPKPLMPVLGSHPLELALWRFGAAGITENAVNSHHMGELIAAYISANPLGQQLKISPETKILGTGGAYNPLRAWLGDCDLVAINGDIVATVDIASLVARHRATGALATMALLPDVIPGESAVWHRDGFVLGIGKAAPAGRAATASNFACVQVLSRAFVDLLPRAGTFDVISQGYERCFAQGLPVAAFVHQGIWHDLRTPQFYWEAVKDLVTRPGALRDTGIEACRTLRSQDAEIGAGVTRKGTVIIEPGCRVGAGARLEDVLLLPGAVVAEGSTLRSRIVGTGLSLPIQGA